MNLPLARLQLAGFQRAGRAILGPLTLEIAPGETLALTGPSGIGKTTVLRIFAGLETDFEGTCTVTGRIAPVFQEPALLPWRNLRDNITITTRVSGAQAAAALGEVGLGARADDFPGQLSLGQQRRVAIARAFAAEPDILLLDEPFVSLDAALAEEMMGLFERLRAAHGVATLLVTHAASEAERLADRIVTLSGSPATITA